VAATARGGAQAEACAGSAGQKGEKRKAVEDDKKRGAHSAAGKRSRRAMPRARDAIRTRNVVALS
jgi:hypothetical protein